ncbi:MAG: anion permease [Acidobacteriia bacterium]|nr:anion permease [Terriglobia bacterium]
MANGVPAAEDFGKAGGFLRSPRKLAGYLLAIAVPVALWFAPLRLEATAKHALAVASFMIIAWISEILPFAITGLLGCYFFWIFKIVRLESAFSGFTDSTTWFLFGASLLGIMATKSGLARRLAYLVLRRVGASYSRLLLGLILTSFVLTFLVPSGMACVVIMAAVALGLMQVFGLGTGSNIGRGLFITLTYTAGMFDKIVMAGATTILGRGLIQKATGIEVYWSVWLLAFFPVAVVVIFFTWRLVLWLYPPENEALEEGAAFLDSELKKMGPWSFTEKKSLFLMLVAIALWATDLLHHISPAVIGIGIGLLAAVPGIGVLNEEDLKRVNYSPIIFTGAAISMGIVLMQTKALQAMTTVMFAWMRPLITNGFTTALVPYWTAFVYHIFLGSELSTIATSIPPLMDFAKSNGLAVLPLGLVWAFAAGGKIFVYQSGVIVTGYSYGYFEARDLFRVGLCLTIVESLVLLLLVPFYWPLIGIR